MNKMVISSAFQGLLLNGLVQGELVVLEGGRRYFEVASQYELRSLQSVQSGDFINIISDSKVYVAHGTQYLCELLLIAKYDKVSRKIEYLDTSQYPNNNLECNVDGCVKLNIESMSLNRINRRKNKFGGDLK